ncbi:uncharacterized protein GIQ15_02774 [Arthroderma uncinatum]|uniref:uncharacterized protein n=1 Tax=Arthroderma uncinatum TaxID=74035 RepID=UPI00144A69FF|nr:uncharacterized protein GIQ15_02774 [Arthroderma uncinatum]KAF3483450.1 hypothetical protein GIQ15_02774 [Arthroderma uncinatum]
MDNTSAALKQQPVSKRARSSRELAYFLLEQCQKLLSELSSFQSYLVTIGKPHLVELRQFKSIVQSELKSLQRLAAKAEEAVAQDAEENAGKAQETGEIETRGENRDPEEDEDSEEEGLGQAELKVLHSLRSSNFPFYANVWGVAKTTCTGIISFNKKFYFYQNNKRRALEHGYEDLAADVEEPEIKANPEPKTGNPDTKMHKRGVLIDIVADNGEEWVKVSTVTPNRLLFDLAKQGWEIGLDSDSDDDDDDGSRTSSTPKMHAYDSEDDDDMIEILKLAVDMKKAAAEVRVRYRHPRIRLVLPKIVEGQVAEIDKIIRKVRKVGVTVECATSEAPSFDFVVDSEVPVDTAIHDPAALFSSLLPNPFPHMTPILNVDCTLLLAFVSDLSHTRDLECLPSYHPAINRQIEFEAQKQLLPSELWPATGDRDLVCTMRAAKRMQEIVDTIGTPKEKERTKLLMGDTDVSDRSVLISKFQELSDYTVPLDWKLPIKVVDSQVDIDRGWKDGSLPFIARHIAQKLSDINRSVFLYGWAAGLTTISSNRTVIKQIEGWIEEQRGDDDEVCGPTVWVCDTARSLIGKDSNRAI